jgi:hypothetical protein
LSQSQADVVKIIGNVTAKAQADSSFRDQYVKNPNGTLSQAGLQIPSGLQFKVLVGNPANLNDLPENTKNLVHLIVPVVGEKVQDESLSTAASSSCTGTASTCFCIPSCISCASTASTNSC